MVSLNECLVIWLGPISNSYANAYAYAYAMAGDWMGVGVISRKNV